MRVALVVPCYIDVFYPEVGIAALELLEKLGVEVEYPFDQTCCGQPMANSGCESDARATEELFIRNFAGFEYIVIPSGSCTHHVRKFSTISPSLLRSGSFQAINTSGIRLPLRCPNMKTGRMYFLAG